MLSIVHREANELRTSNYCHVWSTSLTNLLKVLNTNTTNTLFLDLIQNYLEVQSITADTLRPLFFYAIANGLITNKMFCFGSPYIFS